MDCRNGAVCQEDAVGSGTEKTHAGFPAEPEKAVCQIIGIVRHGKYTVSALRLQRNAVLLKKRNGILRGKAISAL